MSSRFKLLPVLTSKMLTLVISALVVIAITYITFLEVTKSEVELTYNDEEETIITRANTVRELLAELDISASFHDDLRSEEHTSELQSRGHLVCRLLLEKQN